MTSIIAPVAAALFLLLLTGCVLGAEELADRTYAIVQAVRDGSLTAEAAVEQLALLFRAAQGIDWQEIAFTIGSVLGGTVGLNIYRNRTRQRALEQVPPVPADAKAAN
jgi:hypothetical protein